MAEKDIKNENMNTQEEKIRIVTLYSFFDYSVFIKDYSGKVKEKFLEDSLLKFGVFESNEYEKDVRKIVESIRPEIQKRTLADVVSLTIYDIPIYESDYQRIAKFFENRTYKDIAFDILKESLDIEDSIYIRKTFSLFFEERCSFNKIKS